MSVWNVINPKPYKPTAANCPQMCSDYRIAERICYGHPDGCRKCDLFTDRACNWGIEAVKRQDAGATYFDEHRKDKNTEEKTVEANTEKAEEKKRIKKPIQLTRELYEEIVAQENPQIYLMEKYGYKNKSSAYQTICTLRKRFGWNAVEVKKTDFHPAQAAEDTLSVAEENTACADDTINAMMRELQDQKRIIEKLVGRNQRMMAAMTSIVRSITDIVDMMQDL